MLLGGLRRPKSTPSKVSEKSWRNNMETTSFIVGFIVGYWVVEIILILLVMRVLSMLNGMTIKENIVIASRCLKDLVKGQ